jgi:TonB family protein
MDIAGSPGMALGERGLGLVARPDDCPGQAQHASDALVAQQRYTGALAKLEALSTEFSEEGQVRALLGQARQAMERALVKAQALAQCDQLRRTEQFDKALEVLDSALAVCGPEPAILALRSEVEEQRRAEPALEALEQEEEPGKTFQDEWQAAQVFFGKRQFQEAERILVRLAEQDRPDVQALLETVRAARAASEEEQFYKRGRETALKLIQQGLFEQAADLLCNLLTLFPGDPILKKDLRCAQGQQEGPHDDTLVASQDRCELEPSEFQPEALRQKPPVRLVVQLVDPAFLATAPVHARGAVIAAAALFLLVAVSAAVWRFSRNEFPALSQTLATLNRAPLGPVNPRPPPPNELQNADRAVSGAQAPIGVSNFQEVRLLSGPSPVIPPLARVLGIHGIVNLEATVDRRGTVTNVTFLSGQRLLISAATDAALRCRFQPATLNGQPLEVKIRIQVTFEAGRT